MVMRRIVNHHTGGALVPSSFDLQHYHRIVDGDGNVHVGRHAIEANAPGRALSAGKYAAHTARLNSGAIGVAMSCMANGQWSDPFACRAFPRPAQVAELIALNARLCVDYGIAVSRETVLSHGEVEITLGVRQSGKWDFDYDFMDRTDGRDPVVIGDTFRDRVQAAIRAMPAQTKPASQPVAHNRPVLRTGSTGAAVRELQGLLNRHGAKLTADGAFGPKTRTALIQFQSRRELRPDGVCGVLTWAALLCT